MTYLKYFLITLIPVLILFNVYHKNKTEFEQDPNYMYLFNALNFTTKHNGVAMYAHPGTTVVEISGLIMRVTHLLRETNDKFADDVLKNPQYYIKVVVRTFAFMNCLLIFLTGLFILRMTNEVGYSLLFQSVPFFSKTVIPWSFEQFTTEPVLLAIALIFVIVFIRRFYYDRPFGYLNFTLVAGKQLSIDKSSLIFSLIIGFCIATKTNTLPLLLLPFLLLQGFINKFIFLAGTIFVFFFFTLPISHVYRIMFDWYLNLITHTQIYGGGSVGLFDLELLKQNALLTFKTEPFILVIILLSILFLLKQTIRRRYDNHYKLLLSLVLVQLIDLLMILKHFNFHYFIPILPTLAVNVFIMLQTIKIQKLARLALIIPIITICFFLNRDFKKKETSLYKTEYPTDGVNIFSYKSKSPVYALKIGDDFARNKNAEKLSEIYGGCYFYDIWNKKVITWTDTISIDTLLKYNDKVYLHALDHYMHEYPPPFGIDSISNGTYLINNPYRNHSGNN